AHSPPLPPHLRSFPPLYPSPPPLSSSSVVAPTLRTAMTIQRHCRRRCGRSNWGKVDPAKHIVPNSLPSSAKKSGAEDAATGVASTASVRQAVGLIQFSVAPL
uniref:Uncharacterized protein n=1 Tax=Triticum urartu TaxID=4572 RepID=A0A8R7UET8_TRIUA